MKNSDTNSISILITDDHTLIRETWSLLLNTHPVFNVVATCGSGEEAIEKAKVLKPDIVMMDINLPGMNGIQATRQIRKYSPATKILAISMHAQPVYAKAMFRAGAKGYLTKNSSHEEFIAAITTIAKDKTYICPEMLNNISEIAFSSNSSKEGINSLSSRETEVIREIKAGFSSREIGQKLKIAIKTVEVHRYNILKKLKLKNTASLVSLIYQHPEIAVHDMV